MEAQHRVSTNRLTDNLVDQSTLEELIEEVKPSMPGACRGMHYLLATPFRYGHRYASRFRRAGERPGIYYASETLATCLAEVSYYRLLFLSRSPGVRPPRTPLAHTSFMIRVRSARLIDLTREPFLKLRKKWRDANDYTHCQTMARAARGAKRHAIRYESARDPANGINLAILDPAAVRSSEPENLRSWLIRLSADRARVFSTVPYQESFEFTAAQLGL